MKSKMLTSILLVVHTTIASALQYEGCKEIALESFGNKGTSRDICNGTAAAFDVTVRTCRRCNSKQRKIFSAIRKGFSRNLNACSELKPNRFVKVKKNKNSIEASLSNHSGYSYHICLATYALGKSLLNFSQILETDITTYGSERSSLG